MNLTPNLVIGVGITGIGIALTLDRFGLVEAESVMRLWPLLLVLFGASVVAQAFRPQAASPGPPVRQRPIITAPLVFAIVIIGLLFSHASERRTVAARGSSDENVTLFAVMGSDNRTLLAKPFRGGEMTSLLGGSKLDLRQAIIAPGGEAAIDVFAMMAGVTITVPSDWVVDVEAVSVLGGIKDERFGVRRREPQRILAEAEAPGSERGVPSATPEALSVPEPTGPPPRLVLRGFIMMGGLVIRS